MSHYFTDNRQLAHNRKDFTFRFSCFRFEFTSDNGVFSKDGIDFGSKVFLDTLLKQNLGSKILDVGCGYGTLGIVLKKFLPESEVHMVDVNPRALELAGLNAHRNQCDVKIFESNCYENVNDHDYTDIVTNPPIRAGKVVIYKIFEQAKEHLVENGNLWVVIRKQQGGESALRKIREVFGNGEIIAKEKGYFIIKSTKTIDK